MLDSKNIDTKKLKFITNKNDTSVAVMMNLATRNRMREFSDLKRTKLLLTSSGEKIEDKEYIQFWKDLQDVGIGKIIMRGGRPKRFQWHYDLKLIGKLALEGYNFVEDVKPVMSIVPKDRPHIESKIIVIPLRDDYTFSVKIPADLSEKELDLIKKTITNNL